MGEGEKWPYREGEYICACVRLVMDTIYYDDDHIERSAGTSAASPFFRGSV